ncbi:MAG: delta-60 repeat domain-containing protein [Labilithrix sp.]|nr:delta-60 repeat domain-containing protein [Labilithrix sp.]
MITEVASTRTVPRGRGHSTIVIALVAALTSVGCVEDDCADNQTCIGGAGPDVPTDAGPGATPDGDVDVDPDTGKPRDKSFSFEPISPPPRLMHDGSLRIGLSLKRGSGQQEDVTIAVTSLPTGVTVEPLTIPGASSTGELVVRATSAAKQGPFQATVAGSAASVKASTKLDLFVRGKPGELDTTFGTDGRALSVLGAGVTPPRGLVVTASDQILVRGPCGTRTCVSRLTRDGKPDTTYGVAGATSIGIADSSSAVLDSAGRLVIGGASASLPVVGRLLAGGQVDTAFGVAGGVTGALNDAATQYNPASVTSAVAVGAGDVVYAAFTAGTYIGLRKLSSAGSSESSFGTSGVTHYRWSTATTFLNGLVIRGGAVAFAGTWQSSASPATHGFGIAQRLQTNGIADSGYATGGAMTFARPSAVLPSARLLQLPDGRRITAFLEGTSCVLVMFSADGSTLDSSFGQSGRATMPDSCSLLGGVFDLQLQADGKVLAAIRLQGIDRLRRLMPNGTVDTTFAGGAFEDTPFNGSSTYSVAVQSDGRILLGSANSADSTSYVTRIWD